MRVNSSTDIQRAIAAKSRILHPSSRDPSCLNDEGVEVRFARWREWVRYAGLFAYLYLNISPHLYFDQKRR